MTIDPRLHRIVADQPYPLLFATISGAHLYGFPSADSDFDLRGAHILPPAAPSSDIDAKERATVRCLLAALDGSGLEKVVAQSTCGVRSGENCGDLTVMHGLEEGLRAQAIPATIIARPT